MLRIVVVDTTAENRNGLTQQIDSYVYADISEIGFIPRVSLKPLTLEELKFNETPDLCILGYQLFERDASVISKIKKLLPQTILFMKLNRGADTLSKIEMLAGLGIDEVFTDATPAYEFLKKLILLSRKREEKRGGTLLLVDGAKGGVGVSSVAAGLAETVWNSGKKVALLDFDFETQDLSRFLQVRPFVNENLHLLLSGSRPVSEEMVTQALVSMWQDDQRFYVMPPAPESDEIYSARSNFGRNLLSILELLDESFDVVVVDVGSARGPILQTLYRAADRVAYIINNDPASLYSSAARLNKLRGIVSPAAKLLVVENGSQRFGLESGILRQEFELAVKLESEEWSRNKIPFSRASMRWPGSGDTIASLGGAAVLEPLTGILETLGVLNVSQIASRHEVGQSDSFLRRLFSRRSFGLRSEPALTSKASSSEVDTLPEAADAIMIPSAKDQSPKLLHFSPQLSAETMEQGTAMSESLEPDQFFVKAKVG